MSEIQGEFLVLHEHIGLEDFVRVAKSQGWVRQVLHQGNGQTEAYQEIWTTEDRANAIHYVDDPLTMTRFVWVRGPGLRALLFEIVRRLPAYEDEELIEMATQPQGHDEAVQAVLQLAVGFPRVDPRALRLFEIYLQHPSPLVRKATIQAIAYRRWPESMRLIEKAAQEDPDEGARGFARRILEHTPQQGS